MSARTIIVVGDRTDHGGVVLSGATESTIDGQPTARLGDTVSCPQHGENRIVEGSAACTLEGVPIALHGHKTACGSTLIGSRAATVTE
jgi:uncharacterized Zn-binding protein involved in type VI secretion